MPRLCLLLSVGLVTGCGLTLDLAPPDLPVAADASMDAGVDAGPDAAPDAGASCGNRVVEAGEECDDGNDVDGDGCGGDCTFDCTRDEECVPADLCEVVTCDLGLHRCVAAGSVVCPDPSDCERLVGCDPERGCLYEPLEEICDGVDQDCDGSVDEGSGIACGADLDEDGYGDADDAVVACDAVCPDGYADDLRDCWDGARSAMGLGPQLANPDQLNWFLESRGDGTGSFDWNCDGMEEVRWPDLYDGTCDAARGDCRAQSGWTVGFVPPCGEARHAFIACNNGAGGACQPVMSNERQPCR